MSAVSPRAIGLLRGADPEEGFGLRLAKWDDVADGGALAGGTVGLVPCAEVGRLFQSVFYAVFAVEGDGERFAGIDLQPDGLGWLGVAAVVIGCAGGGLGQALGCAVVTGASHGFVRFLLPKDDFIGQAAVRVEQQDGFAVGVEFEGEVNLIAGLLRFVVGPNQKKTASREGGALGEEPFARGLFVVGQRPAGEVDIVLAVVVQLDPVVEVAVGGIGEGAVVGGHPFVDLHVLVRERFVAGVLHLDSLLAIGERLAGAVDRGDGVAFFGGLDRQDEFPSGESSPLGLLWHAVDEQGFHSERRGAAEGDGLLIGLNKGLALDGEVVVHAVDGALEVAGAALDE